MIHAKLLPTVKTKRKLEKRHDEDIHMYTRSPEAIVARKWVRQRRLNPTAPCNESDRHTLQHQYAKNIFNLDIQFSFFLHVHVWAVIICKATSVV